MNQFLTLGWQAALLSAATKPYAMLLHFEVENQNQIVISSFRETSKFLKNFFFEVRFLMFAFFLKWNFFEKFLKRDAQFLEFFFDKDDTNLKKKSFLFFFEYV